MDGPYAVDYWPSIYPAVRGLCKNLLYHNNVNHACFNFSYLVKRQNRIVEMLLRLSLIGV